MTALIAPELMEDAWSAVAQMSADQLQERQALCGEEQEALTEFAMAFLGELSSDAAGVGLYTHVVLMEAFRRTNARFRAIGPATIEKTWNDNLTFVDGLEQAGIGRRSFRLEPGRFWEPAALQYAVDALTEDDEEDPVEIDDDEFRQALRVLKTVIDCMHDAQRTE
jgi:hypothetical protein